MINKCISTFCFPQCHLANGLIEVLKMLFKDLPRDALIRPLTRNEVVGMLLRLTIFGAATYYSIKWVVEAMDPTTKQKSQAKKRVRGTKHVTNLIL